MGLEAILILHMLSALYVFVFFSYGPKWGGGGILQILSELIDW